MLTDSQRTALATRLRRGREYEPARIPRRPADLAELPVSSAQEQLWFVHRLAAGLPAYNIPLALALSGPLDCAALGRAVDALVARHEALRTRLVTGASGRPAQVIDPPATVPLPLVADLSALRPPEREVRLSELIAAEAIRPFTLFADALLRTWLVRLGDAEHILLVVVHHAVFDGWSARVLVGDLAALYEQEACGTPAALDELPIQFADYAVWERGRLGETSASRLASYWRATLASHQTLSFPADRPRPVVDSFGGAIATRLTDPQLLQGVRELSRREGTTPLVTIMAALATLAHRYTGQADLTIGTVSASRSRPELAPLIGFCVNTLPIRMDLSGDPSFSEVVARVREATTAAYAHQDLPFAQIVQAAGVERDPGRTPLFQIALSYAERDAAPIRAADVDFVLSDLVVGVDAAKFDLDFLAEARSGGLWFECTYKTALFDSGTVRRLLGHLEMLLRGAIADPSARISALPVLTSAELRSELAEWNQAAGPIRPACVHELFGAQVLRTPDAVAAEYGDERVSYAALNRQANQIARRLRHAGVGPDDLVGVCMQAGIRRLAAFLAIWKAGGGYVPLDPALPADRLSFMISDAAMPVVITDQAGAAAIPAGGPASTLSLDASWPEISELDDGDVTDASGSTVTPRNVAYVIYTSGSTGQPKGVVIEHRQAASFLHAMVSHWDVGPSDAVLQFASVSFDASVQEMFMPLIAGARVILAPVRTLHSPVRLAALMRDRCVTFAVLTPAVVSLLGDERFPDLRVLMCGGEAMPADLVGRWLRPGLRFVNDYGPTETTVTATVMELDATTPLPPPIGRPIPGWRAYVLDARLNPVPVGVTGELHIGGQGVARGYLNRPALTSERFIPDPFVPGERLYKTGDLVRRRPDGTLVFTGRVDGQVKIRGLRIELGEIETTLNAHPAVAQAVVIVITDPSSGERQLAAYLRAQPGALADPASLRAHLARTLPAYMIPAHLVSVAEFPLSTSGKIDRAALPPPPDGHQPTADHEPAPGTETTIARLFSAVLRRERVSATTNFFSAGGSSLQAMRLVDLISAEFDADIDAVAIFLSPTPHELAASVEAATAHTAAARRPGPLIELARGPGENPLFLIHAVGGTVFAYARLAQELAGTFGVHGLQAPGLSEPGSTAPSLAGLVADYTRRIAEFQPAGPYHLAGWSMGGIIAFEVARRLELAGADVGMLLLLDAPFAIPDGGQSTESAIAAQFAADAVVSLGLDAAGQPGPATSAASQLSWLADRISGSDKSGGGPAGEPLHLRYEVFRAHTQMLGGYQPAEPAIAAPALIVSAGQSPNAAARARWPRVLGGPVRMLTVDADHYSFLRPPAVERVATWIRRQHDELAAAVARPDGPGSVAQGSAAQVSR